jgi:hypothetical protein
MTTNTKSILVVCLTLFVVLVVVLEHRKLKETMGFEEPQTVTVSSTQTSSIPRKVVVEQPTTIQPKVVVGPSANDIAAQESVTVSSTQTSSIPRKVVVVPSTAPPSDAVQPPFPSPTPFSPSFTLPTEPPPPPSRRNYVEVRYSNRDIPKLVKEYRYRTPQKYTALYFTYGPETKRLNPMVEVTVYTRGGQKQVVSGRPLSSIPATSVGGKVVRVDLGRLAQVPSYPGYEETNPKYITMIYVGFSWQMNYPKEFPPPNVILQSLRPGESSPELEYIQKELVAQTQVARAIDVSITALVTPETDVDDFPNRPSVFR